MRTLPASPEHLPKAPPANAGTLEADFRLTRREGAEEHWVRSTRGVSRCAVWVAGPSLDLVGKDISHLCFLGPAVQRPCSIWKLAPCRVCLFLFYDVEPGNTSRARVLGRCTVARLLSWFWMKTLSTRGDTPLSSAPRESVAQASWLFGRDSDCCPADDL